jgi:hypothetical protein
LRASNCETALKTRPVFDTTDPALAACEMELCDIFEGRFWASVDDGAKEHCIYLFADFLYRNWTTHALVLDCFQQELKTLPPVLQVRRYPGPYPGPYMPLSSPYLAPI